MKIEKLMTIDAILKELGARLERRRINMHLTQAALAEEAGLSKRTIERIESGLTSQMSSFIRILRVLDLLLGLETLIPSEEISPIDLIKIKNNKRMRASRSKKKEKSSKWKWSE